MKNKPIKRHKCTKEVPWSPEKGKYAYHPDAHEIGEQKDGWPEGDLIKMECPICGRRWEEELPQ